MDEVKKYMSVIGKKRFEGKTKEEVSAMMSEVRRKGLEKKKQAQDSLLTNRL